ncbi:DUF5060 domain-containing protein [Rhodopirellula bahusiensis]|uniref:DUF5060 domain-containing protein n=1 Tax=Rhodopirellula bahusiensis TaxID=2014065 RepID=A0A2G1W5Y9_9BACT|nr:DUF5060 domain-containing protein [Rhodopirellula bahusiensis]PHQ34059.1 hypothetical protein CEE69_17340 [Rhodopirellula bahusiensis]
MKRISVFVCALIAIGNLSVPAAAKAADVSLSGELRQWHAVTLTVDGPEASEQGTPNPFLDYRMEVAFMNADSGVSYIVPGYFAADGDAANTSATSGNKWRAHLCPDHAGEWTYKISFRKGPSVAISDDENEGTPVESVDGLQGTITIAATDKSGRDFRGKGRLNYVGKHHLQFAGTEEYFLKAGADAPENFLAYRDFDGDFKTDGKKDNLVKDWQPHVQDWMSGDPTWQGDKGKGIIGAINYLASQGLNAFSFLTLNIEGDDRNVFPYTAYDERSRMDCSRMDQWEIVLSHGDKMGMYLHFKTQEAENVNLLDNGETGPQRKLYYRELIARFSHHLAMNWNLGEEVGLGHKVSTEKKVAWAKYFWNHDPYQHHIVIHNGNRHYDMLGNASQLTGFSLQTNKPDFRNVHGQTLDYLRRSVQAGKPWVVACDEPGDAQHSLVTDEEDPTRNNARQNALWGNFMAGGAGVEWYFGYKHPHSDLTCQDYRVRENMWRQCRIALKFFANEKIPFQNMTNANDLLGTKNGYCFADAGKLYLVYLKQADTTTLDLNGVDREFEILWFNPRTGGDLQAGSVQTVNGGDKVNLGQPPMDSDQDWLAVLRPTHGAVAHNTTAMNASPQNKSNPNSTARSSANEALVLNALTDFQFVTEGDFVPGYKDKNRRAMAIDAAKFQDKFAAAEAQYQGQAGTFDLVLTALTETDGESSYRLLVAGKLVGEVQNPETAKDYAPNRTHFKQVDLHPGDTIRVEFNSASNGKIPEGDAFAFSRGRWRSVTIVQPGSSAGTPAKQPSSKTKNANAASSAKTPFNFTYDPSKAKRVSRQTDGIVVVEAEDFDAVDRQDHRKWYVTRSETTPGILPDPDPNHADGASNGAYLEILPDTRVTHSDPLVNGVSFSNTPGQCSVLYYPVEITEPGRYYVWVRMCCTGSEDNGLHVGIDGQWPESGARMQWTGKHGQWQWDSRQRTEKVHTGVLGKIWLDIDEPGRHTVMFSMREDGFEFDRFLLTQTPQFLKSKNSEMGPIASPMR